YGVKIFNVPTYINEITLKNALHELFHNSVMHVEIIMGPTDNSLGIAFIKFYQEMNKNNCLMLQQENKFVFVHDQMWEGPLILQSYKNQNEINHNDENKRHEIESFKYVQTCMIG
ncbi:unnamed protein product, partial [Rotaria magnacalcarata]